MLAFVPLSFLTAALAGWLLPVPTRTFVAGAGLASALALIDALFVNPPRPGSLT
ncbi:hypothetical protein [Haloarchaeobius sp. HRN-SO-5]|uniref:hypothetical protein n=1 Tax=Haloarchaeobius sp. HRN-SO-5 TaxID=3446118 RepID=UPI003EB7B931